MLNRSPSCRRRSARRSCRVLNSSGRRSERAHRPSRGAARLRTTRSLSDAASTRTDANEAYVAPRSATERTLANIWQEVLKVEKVGINDNFFGLGGHSLLLVHAQSKVSEALRVNVSMIELFKYPTVSALAEHLSDRRRPIPAPPATRNQAEMRLEALNRQRQLRQRATRNAEGVG